MNNPFSKHADRIHLDPEIEQIYQKIDNITVPLGGIILFPVNSLVDQPGIKNSFMLCDGRALGREEFSELYGVFGNFFGGSTTLNNFNLPTAATGITGLSYLMRVK